MTPINRITIHHDGMAPFTSTDRSAATSRLESIRRAHLRRQPQPFGDIGYHYAIDPAGRVWAGRPISWQGAHVRAQNQGNLGIVVLGNYDQQALNSRQKRALVRFLQDQMNTYGIRSHRVATHQEMAPTACPGKSLQSFMVTARSGPLS
ncbi:MAG: peptidoglycan recognition family protein [Phycisphaerales bacterium]|jgi:N-acetyl-anhydromuramyl-L-alanine amidase AmpD|nr:peptidoglycan recognition family protein [Phycisphaerales bacterium]